MKWCATRDARSTVLCEEQEEDRFYFHEANTPEPKAYLPLTTPLRICPTLKSKAPSEVKSCLAIGQEESYSWKKDLPTGSKAWPKGSAGISQLTSNHPVEDRAVITSINVGNKRFLDEDASSKCPWLLGAVIDGHGGWQVAEYVAKNLPHKIRDSICGLDGKPLTATSLGRKVVKAFEDLDAELQKVMDSGYKLGHSGTARVGATTVVAMVSPHKIVIGNVGDSLAVLCRNGTAITLSAEHNARVPEEAKRLREAHPNEDDVVYVKNSVSADSEELPPAPRLSWFVRWLTKAGPASPTGAAYTKAKLQLTRAFGDFCLKDSKWAMDFVRGKILVKPPYSFPYITATPEITIVQRDEAADDFLILASDGVWDELSPQEACDIVRRHRRGTVSEASQAVHDEVLRRASTKNAQTADRIMKLSPKERRKMIDDQTIVIIRFKD